MFDIGFSEIVLIAVAALIAIGPEDLPGVLFRLGRLTRQIKIFLNGIRNEYAEIIHEAEVEHYRKEFGAGLKDEALIDAEHKPVTALPRKPDEPIVFDDDVKTPENATQQKDITHE
jgi:sec-independent protein translocase protein TatB